MNRTLDSDLDELGAQLGHALHRRVASQGVRSIGLDPILAGAARRRARRRSGVIVVCLALIAAGGAALTTRAHDSVVGDDGDGSTARPALLPAFALLEGAPGVGDPASMSAQRGGTPMGVSVPRIDVWESGDQRLVVRSVDNTEVPIPPGVTTTVVATTAVATGSSEPWGERRVSKLQIREVDGAIQELAADQFAVWVPTTSPDRYSLVIARGMSRAEALAEVAALVDVDGVLQPASGFIAIEQAAALPASTPSSAYAGAQYNYLDDLYVATYLPPVGRSSLETIDWTTVGRLESISGRDVMVDDNPLDGTASATWLDPSGAVTTVALRGGDVATLVPFVHMVDQAVWLRQSVALSDRMARDLPVAGRVSIGSASLIYRSSNDKTAFCLAFDATEACVNDSSQSSPVSLADQVEINGHWVIFGYRQILPDEEPNLTGEELKFTSASGSCCDVETVKHGDAIWFMVQVDDGVDVVDTNVGNLYGGIVGSISRPLVAANIS
jgi:hypothetical protein